MELRNTRYEIDEHGVATVWLHQPSGPTAWTGHLHREYRWIFSRLEADPEVRAVPIVTGTGNHFSVGADSSTLDVGVERGYYDPGLGEGTANPGYGVRPDFDHDLAWQWALRFPVIAAVNGGCAGVALSLACFCDMRFAYAGAKLTTAAPKLGLPAEYGLSWVLPRLVGTTAAADLLMSGHTFTAAEAPPGLFNAVLDTREDLLAHATAYAQHIAVNTGPRPWPRPSSSSTGTCSPSMSASRSRETPNAASTMPWVARGVSGGRQARLPGPPGAPLPR